MPARQRLAMLRAVAASALPRRSRPATGGPGAAARETAAGAMVAPPRELKYPFAASAEIPASPQDVFAVLADPARMPDWLVLHTGWAGTPPARITDGARFAQRAKLMGMATEVRWTASGVREPASLWLDGTGPMGIVVGLYLSLGSLGTAGSGTLVRIDGGVEGGSADGPLGPMVARNLADAMTKSLQRLAAAVADRPGAAGAPASRTSPREPRSHDKASGRLSGQATPERREPPRPRPVRTPKPAPVRHERTGREIDAWTPVIVGVGQVSERSTDPLGADPVSLAVRALRAAEQDSGVTGLLSTADSVAYVPSVSWQYPDGAALIAAAVGAAPAETVRSSTFGGDGGLRLINDAAASIVAGHATVVLVGGAEAAATAAAAEKAGRELGWPGQPEGAAPGRIVGVDLEPNNDPETAAGLVAPIYMYALIESAVRGKLGLSVPDHQRRITELWSRFSAVAAENPYAWLPGARTADELAGTSGENRPISAPYPKLLTAHLQVNQATGVILCSAAAAEAAGIPQDRWVFPHAGAHATDEWFVSERADLAASPAIRAAGAAVLNHAGLDISDITHVDLYACFPSAVEIAADELGLDLQRQLTVTGGLTFAGGPGNNYSGHAVANLVPLLRADPEASGLATALGWYLTKHAAGVFSATPPERPYADVDADLRMPRPAARTAAGSYAGPAVLEAYTIPYDRSGSPAAAVVTALAPDGARIVRRATDPELIARLLADDPLGWTVEFTADTVTVTDTTRSPLPAPAEPPLIVEWHGPVTVFRLHRPAVRNAIDLATARALERAVDAFEADPSARVAVLTGGDTTFCSGMDLKAAARGEYPITEGRGLLGITARPPAKPLIAAVEGSALAGGCELALAADLIVAAEDAWFGIPEVKRGLIAAAGGVLRLAQSLPRSTALEMALTGAPLPARRLHELGLINRVTGPGKALKTALELAQEIAANAPLSVRLSKRIVDEHRDWSTAESFDRLSDFAGEVIGSADAREGIRAFAEGRAPQWKGI
ncbi:putative enoyl-CoA hydratase [Actinoplanes missouriensis 431]|uniref:Putative enoyl-CoA hydratase n=1 Tax=Actinoplanes missouriensis (strain ATCC 14538 / DSM 43046 / CBS 188.64 / JCM 3121 / NBRC 102363 / NCIMB 12654 / NRRL B-3342 / UNCC 431) TaxID=512565 RepID=I0H8U4_ACTM4|nr:crotonase/enoyl-CoA hydratase family protein [Actinoplanes missouriensis]BAL89431.1 putative enoyl-CoA hydratase [Actinoplanes missouriensis 431]